MDRIATFDMGPLMIPCWPRFRSIVAAGGLLLICAMRPASALDMPSPFVQEVLIKSILVSLNDAVAANNFTVFHTKISKPFCD